MFSCHFSRKAGRNAGKKGKFIVENAGIMVKFIVENAGHMAKFIDENAGDLIVIITKVVILNKDTKDSIKMILESYN